jgi:hypothetical protein
MLLPPARTALTAVALLSALIIAACDDTAPAAGVPATPNATASSPLPLVFLLRPDQMRGYTRSNSRVLSPDIVAADASNPTLAKTLSDQGYQEGAQATFSPPQQNPAGLPFGQVVTQAAIFTDAAGATRNVAMEKVARNQLPTNGGSIRPVTDLPATGVDSLTVFVAESTDGSSAAQSYLAIMRRGRVVGELFAGGDPTTATEKNFSALLLVAESQLSSAPG